MSERRRVWAWPTAEAWFLIAALTVFAGGYRGWIWAAVVLAFFAVVNVVGNLMLPQYREVSEEPTP